MKRVFITSTLLLVFLFSNPLLSQPTEKIIVTDTTDLAVFQGEKVTLHFVNGQIEKGNIIYYDGRIFLYNEKHNIYDASDIELIKEKGLTIDGVYYLSSQFEIIGDSLIVPNQNIYSREAIKAISIRRKDKISEYLTENTNLNVYHNKTVTLQLVNGSRETGRLIVDSDRLFILSGPLKKQKFNQVEIDSIRSNGLFIGGISYAPKEISIIGDTLVIPNNKIYSVSEVRRISVKRAVPFKRVNLSTSCVFPFVYMAGNDLSNQMRSSDLADTKYSYGESTVWVVLLPPKTTSYNNTENYPTLKRSVALIDFEVSYHINPNHGLLFNFTGKNNVTVSGFKELGQDQRHTTQTGSASHDYWNYGNSVSISVENRSISLAYLYSLLNQRISFVVGGSFVPTKVAPSTNEAYSLNQFGLIAGCAANIFHKRTWFVNLKTYYRWSPNLHLGPYSVTGYTGSGDQYTSNFEEVDVRMSVISVAIGFGLRF